MDLSCINQHILAKTDGPHHARSWTAVV